MVHAPTRQGKLTLYLPCSIMKGAKMIYFAIIGIAVVVALVINGLIQITKGD